MALLTRRAILGMAAGVGGLLTACRVAGRPATQEGQPTIGPTTLEHMDWWSPEASQLHKEYFEGLAKEINERYPQITVKYVFAPNTTGVREKWIVLSAAGTPVDTSQVSVAFVRYLMEADLLEPLDSYMARTPHMALSNFVDTGLFYNTYQGKHYGVPYDGPATGVIAYNIEHFREVGLNPSREFTWKWTAEQFLDAARRLVKREGEQIVRGGFTPPGGGSESFCRWLYPFGGKFYAPDYKRVLFNDQKGRDTLQFMVDLRHKHNIANPTQGATFENEQISMVISGSWASGYHLERNPNLKFDFAPYPRGPQGQQPGSVTWTNMWSMAKASTKKEAAWLWMSYVNAEPTLERWFAGHYKRAAGRKEFYKSEAWKQVTRQYPSLVDIEKLADMSGEYPWVKPDEITRETADLWRRIINNEIAVNEALNQMEQICNRILAGG